MMLAFASSSVPQWATLIVLLVAAYGLRRGGVGSAVSELQKANAVLEKRNRELGAEVRDLRIENESLKAHTDYATSLRGALSPITDWMQKHEAHDERRHQDSANAFATVTESLKAFDIRAEQRSRQTLNVLQLMADHMGAEHE